MIHGLREYLILLYRRLLDILQEMHGLVEKMGLRDQRISILYDCVRSETEAQGSGIAYPSPPLC